MNPAIVFDGNGKDVDMIMHMMICPLFYIFG
jgi:hypothetical protein